MLLLQSYMLKEIHPEENVEIGSLFLLINWSSTEEKLSDLEKSMDMNIPGSSHVVEFHWT